MRTAKKRLPLTIHPYIVNLLCNTHMRPSEFEERRLNGQCVFEMILNERPANEWLIEHSSHAEALINYMFVIDYDYAEPEVCRLLLYLLTIVPATPTTVGDDVLERIAPSFSHRYEGVPLRISAFLYFAHACPYAIETKHAPEQLATIYACMDELLFENRIVPYTKECVPDCTILRSMAVIYKSGLISDKREIKRNFRFLDDQNIDLMDSLINIFHKLYAIKKITAKEYCRVLVRACMIDPHVCEFVTKLLLVQLCVPMPENADSPALENAHVLFLPTFMREDSAREAREIVHSRTEKYQLFYAPANKLEFIESLSEENSAFITSLMMIAGEILPKRHVPKIPPSAPVADWIEPRVDTGGVVYAPGRELLDILKECEAINYGCYKESPSDAVPGKEYLMPDPNPLISPEKRAVMKQCIGPTALVIDDIPWLVCFGVPVHEIECMQQMIKTPNAGMRAHLMKLYENKRDIYAVFFTYFQLLEENCIYYEVEGDLEMWAKHTQAAAAHYDLEDGDVIPPVVGCVMACDNCRDVKHPSFYFRKVKAQINGTGKILGTATKLFCAKTPKPANWHDQDIITHRELAPGARLTICGSSKFMIGAPREIADRYAAAAVETSAVDRRKFGKFISTQIWLNKCADTELRKLCILGRFCVYDRIVYTGCYRCLRFSSLEDLIHYGGDILCDDCILDELDDIENSNGGDSKSKQNRGCIRCGYCSKDITILCKKNTTSEYHPRANAPKSLFLFADTLPNPCFCTVHFCANHNHLRWVRQYDVSQLSVVLHGIKNKWGMRNSDGTIVPVGDVTGHSGFQLSKSTL